MSKKIKKIVIEMASRSAHLDLTRTENKSDGPIPTILASEKPTRVVDWSRWEMVREILLMSGVEIPESRQVPLFDSHRVWGGTEALKGSVRNIRVVNDQLEGDTLISEVEEKIRKKVDEGHITDVSAGYRTYKAHSIVIPPGQERDVDGTKYKNDYGDDLDLVVRTKWTINEESIAAIGADDRSKFKREMSLEFDDSEERITAQDPGLQSKLDQIIDNQNNLERQFSEIKVNGGNDMPDKPEEKTREQQAAADVQDILKFGEERYNGRHMQLATQAVRDGKTFTEFNSMVLDAMEQRGSDFETPHSQLDMPKSDLKRYSISNLIDYQIRKAQGELRSGEDGGVEMEAHNEIVKRIGAPQKGGTYLAHDYKRYMAELKEENVGKRAHSAGTPGEGGVTIATDLRDDLLVKDLKNSLALGQLGATVIAGLRGNFTVPKILTGLSAYSVAENTAATKSFITLGQLAASPKHVSAYTEYGRQLFYQSSLSFDQVLFEQLNDAKNIKVDHLGINGLGTGNEPLGLLNQSGPAAQVIEAPSWRKILGFRKTIKKANADKGSFKFGCSVDVETELMATEKSAGNPIYLMNDKGDMAGAGSVSSNQFPDQVLAYGNWSQLYLLFWGVDELLINPFSQGSKGIVELNIFTMMDVMLRESAAFSISDDVAIPA